MSALLDHPFIEEHRHLVKTRVTELSRYINDGKCTSFDEYKKKTGVIEGLRLSLELMVKASKTYANDGDDE